MRRSGKRILTVTGMCLAALLTTGCLQEGGNGGDGGGSEGGGQAQGDGKVSILGAFPDPEAGFFRDSLEEFEKESGIDITYTASTDFTTEIRTRTQGGNPPDIALFPQPGLVLELGAQGHAIPLGEMINLDSVKETVIPGFLDSVTAENGKIYAAPMRMAVKSLVWYPKPEFEQAGYEVPKTWAELQALGEQIQKDGSAAWCLGAEAGADTGWVLTDWVEDLVLRSAGPETYDKWYQHEIPFNDPAIQKAVSTFGEDVLFDDGAVLGGPQAVLTTPFDVSPQGLFTEPPECYLHRQGNFVTGFFPEDVQKNLSENVGIFVLPPIEDGYEGTPILGGGDMAAAFKNDPDVVKVMEFITSDEFGGPWAEAGGWLSPHKTFDSSQYSSDLTRQISDLVKEADVFRFDASDLMPPEVGAGTFWDNMVAWTAGEKSVDEALTSIEESWPQE